MCLSACLPVCLRMSVCVCHPHTFWTTAGTFRRSVGVGNTGSFSRSTFVPPCLPHFESREGFATHILYTHTKRFYDKGTQGRQNTSLTRRIMSLSGTKSALVTLCLQAATGQDTAPFFIPTRMWLYIASFPYVCPQTWRGGEEEARKARVTLTCWVLTLGSTQQLTTPHFDPDRRGIASPLP